MWQDYGILCVDAMTYYRKQPNKSLNEIMESDSVSEFHTFPFYHKLLRRNINPVILDNLTESKETKSSINLDHTQDRSMTSYKKIV
jgi:hypothetical protein